MYLLQMILSSVLLLTVLVFLRESRSNVLLARQAAELAQKNPGKTYCADGDERAPLMQLIKGAIARPIGKIRSTSFFWHEL